MRPPFRSIAGLRARDDRGVTLVEMLVATVLLVLVITLTTAGMVKAMRQDSYLGQQTTAQERNDTGMELATRLLRQAVYPTNGTTSNSSIITVASPTQIQFTSRFSSTGTATASPNSFNTSVQQFLIKLNGTTLQWGSAAQNSCSGTSVCTYGTPTASTSMVYGVQNANGKSVCPSNTGDGAIFHYFYINTSGVLTAWSSSTNTLGQIQVVEITLWTKTPSPSGTQQASCDSLTNYVELRNFQ